jgi:hypothetical protein
MDRMRRCRVSAVFAPSTFVTCALRWLGASTSNRSREPASARAAARSSGSSTVRGAVSRASSTESGLGALVGRERDQVASAHHPDRAAVGEPVDRHGHGGAPAAAELFDQLGRHLDPRVVAALEKGRLELHGRSVWQVADTASDRRAQPRDSMPDLAIASNLGERPIRSPTRYESFSDAAPVAS